LRFKILELRFKILELRFKILELGRNDKIMVCSLSIVALNFETGIKTKWERKPTDFVTEVTERGKRFEVRGDKQL
jgi:hypothetical protein